MKEAACRPSAWGVRGELAHHGMPDDNPDDRSTASRGATGDVGVGVGALAGVRGWIGVPLGDERPR